MSDVDMPENFGFDFAPDWARKSADEYVSRYQDKDYDERTGREGHSRRDSFRDRPPRREYEDRSSSRGPRPPRNNENDSRSRRDFSDRPSMAPVARQEESAPRSYRPRNNDERSYQRQEPVYPLDADIRILPNQKNLGVIIKTLQSTHIAFPMKKFVNLFLDNPQACLVRFEVAPESETRFWTCKTCGFVTLSEDEMVQHILTTHLADIFEVSEEACEPPSGSYPCVAKCTLTGEWVGAPNHHSYKRRVAELAARTGMSERDYLRTIEMFRDAESVDAWKQSVTKQTVYRLKQQPVPAVAPVAVASETEAEEGAPVAVEASEPVTEEAVAPVVSTIAYNHEQAEAFFRSDIMPKIVTVSKHVCLPVSLAQTSSSLPLKLLLKYTLRDEQRYPRSLFFALRGAFRHRKFTLFRGNDPRGPEFVANMIPTPFNTEHMVKELKTALDYVAEHPLCTRTEMLVALKTQLPEIEPAKLATQVAFLFQKGHIVEYYNGVLALSEANPKFRKLPEETRREQNVADEPKPAEEAQPTDQMPAASPVTEAATPASIAECTEIVSPTMDEPVSAPVETADAGKSSEETPRETE
ncbi:MAG: hypothetical protein RR133_01885 [Kiritimatiellia bacterium]